MSGYLRAMKHYAVFQGRASRAEFWQFTLALVLIGFVALMIDGATVQEMRAHDTKDPAGIVTALVVLAHLLPSFALTVRRLHDTNRTGWLVLLNLLPPLNLIILFLMCLRGVPGPNRFGPAPLGAAVSTDAATTALAAAGGRPEAALRPLASPTRHDLIAELERLGRLRKDGHLSETEFDVMKAETLAQARGAWPRQQARPSFTAGET